jgi:hypothetical protein
MVLERCWSVHCYLEKLKRIPWMWGTRKISESWAQGRVSFRWPVAGIFRIEFVLYWIVYKLVFVIVVQNLFLTFCIFKGYIMNPDFVFFFPAILQQISLSASRSDSLQTCRSRLVCRKDRIQFNIACHLLLLHPERFSFYIYSFIQHQISRYINLRHKNLLIIMDSIILTHYVNRFLNTTGNLLRYNFISD